MTLDQAFERARAIAKYRLPTVGEKAAVVLSAELIRTQQELAMAKLELERWRHTAT